MSLTLLLFTANHIFSYFSVVVCDTHPCLVLCYYATMLPYAMPSVLKVQQSSSNFSSLTNKSGQDE